MVNFTSDKFSIVKLYKHIKGNFVPDETYGIDVGRFFRRHAAEKELNRRRTNFQYLVSLYNNNVWSVKYFSDKNPWGSGTAWRILLGPLVMVKG